MFIFCIFNIQMVRLWMRWWWWRPFDICYIVIVIIDWKNSSRVDMSLHSYTFSWFRPNQFSPRSHSLMRNCLINYVVQDPAFCANFFLRSIMDFARDKTVLNMDRNKPGKWVVMLMCYGLSFLFLLNFETVPTMWYLFSFSFYYIIWHVVRC
jgi:hypothetical protein